MVRFLFGAWRSLEWWQHFTPICWIREFACCVVWCVHRHLPRRIVCGLCKRKEILCHFTFVSDELEDAGKITMSIDVHIYVYVFFNASLLISRTTCVCPFSYQKHEIFWVSCFAHSYKVEKKNALLRSFCCLSVYFLYTFQNGRNFKTTVISKLPLFCNGRYVKITGIIFLTNHLFC